MPTQVPTTKVKLIVGQGGETIKFIQKKSKCRLQVEKTEEQLEARRLHSLSHSSIYSYSSHKHTHFARCCREVCV